MIATFYTDVVLGNDKPAYVSAYYTANQNGVQQKMLNVTRVGVLDSDNDGIPDYLEKVLGTDPHKLDTNGDEKADGIKDVEGYNGHEMKGLKEEPDNAGVMKYPGTDPTVATPHLPENKIKLEKGYVIKCKTIPYKKVVRGEITGNWKTYGSTVADENGNYSLEIGKILVRTGNTLNKYENNISFKDVEKRIPNYDNVRGFNTNGVDVKLQIWSDGNDNNQRYSDHEIVTIDPNMKDDQYYKSIIKDSEKIFVKDSDKDNLSEDQKNAIVENIKAKNHFAQNAGQSGSDVKSININQSGEAVLAYADGTNSAKFTKDKTVLTYKGPEIQAVNNISSLTTDEKDNVKTAIIKANPNLSLTQKIINVNTDGSVKIDYTNTKGLEFTQAQTVKVDKSELDLAKELAKKNLNNLKNITPEQKVLLEQKIDSANSLDDVDAAERTSQAIDEAIKVINDLPKLPEEKKKDYIESLFKGLSDDEIKNIEGSATTENNTIIELENSKTTGKAAVNEEVRLATEKAIEDAKNLLDGKNNQLTEAPALSPKVEVKNPSNLTNEKNRRLQMQLKKRIQMLKIQLQEMTEV